MRSPVRTASAISSVGRTSVKEARGVRLACVTSHRDTLNSVRPEAELFIGLVGAGVDVTVFTQADSVYAERMRAAGVEVIDFAPRGKIALRSVRFLRSAFVSGRFDVVYAFNNKAIANTNMAALGLPLKVVTYRGQTGNVHRFDPSVYLTHLHPRVDAVIAVAEAVSDSLRPHLRSNQRIFTVYKGHDLDWYRDAPLDRARIGLDDSHCVLTCVANNRPRKGIPVLLDAFSRLDTIEALRLVLIGSGMDAATLGPPLADLGLTERVVPLGFRSDAPAVLAASDFSVLPAIKREGLPKSVIESMAYGVAPIVTDTGGSAELVADRESGLVVPPADPAALVSAIETLARDPALCERLGAAAQRRIAERFSVARSVEGTLTALTRIVTAERNPASKI